MAKLALVSYMNTRPYLDGLQRFFSPEEVELVLLAPAKCAEALWERKVDMALMPVGGLADFDAQSVGILPDYCIGANGKVESVFLFSQKPVDQLDAVILDSHSRTSNALTQVLMRYHWKHKVEWEQATEEHFDQIQGTIGGVVIGDRAVKIRDRYEYVYDLSEEWKDMTGLPFAFAVWVYYPECVPRELCQRIQQALGWGIAQAEQSAVKWASHYGMTVEFATKYLQKDIQFEFCEGKHEAVHLFFHTLSQMEIVGKRDTTHPSFTRRL